MEQLLNFQIIKIKFYLINLQTHLTQKVYFVSSCISQFAEKQSTDDLELTEMLIKLKEVCLFTSDLVGTKHIRMSSNHIGDGASSIFDR